MELKDFFYKYNKVAVGFSGGVDSSYLLYAAKKYCADIKAYYVKTQFQPEFELEDAKKVAKKIGADIIIVNYDILRHNNIKDNNLNRCYHCKRIIFEIIKEYAEKDGYTTIIEGTNASDDIFDRPGFKALSELNIKSPLRDCGLTKDNIRKLLKNAGLFTWNKAAYACLATRVNTNNEITADKLIKIEKSENILKNMDFHNFRARIYYNALKLQFKETEIEKAFKQRVKIYDELKEFFDDIVLDLKSR